MGKWLDVSCRPASDRGTFISKVMTGSKKATVREGEEKKRVFSWVSAWEKENKGKVPTIESCQKG